VAVRNPEFEAPDCEFLVYSSAVRPDHVAFRATADQSPVRYRRRELLARLAAGRRLLAVAGSHGKTTTTAMIAWAAREAGIAMDYLIGGLPQGGLEPARERAVDDIECLGRCFARYFEAALRGAGDDSLGRVNYDTLKSPAALARVLQRGFGFETGAHELALMQEQFRFYSKDDADRLGFEADSAEKSASLDAAERELVHRLCGDWLRALDEAPQNLENLT